MDGVVIAVICFVVGIIITGIAAAVFFFYCQSSAPPAAAANKEKSKSSKGQTLQKTPSKMPKNLTSSSAIKEDDNSLQANTRSMIEAREMYGDRADLNVSAMPSADIYKVHFKDTGIQKAEETLKELDKRPQEKPGLGDKSVIDTLKNKAGAKSADDDSPSALLAQNKAFRQTSKTKTTPSRLGAGKGLSRASSRV